MKCQQPLILQSILLLALTLTLSGCGFHLRGHMPLPPQLKNIYIETTTPYDPLIADLKNTLHDINITVSDTPKHALTLHIISQNINKSLGNISASTNTRQFTIYYSVTFEMIGVSGTKQQQIIPVNTITSFRSLTVNSNQMLGSTSEEQTILQEMRQTLIQMMVAKLGAKNTVRQLSLLR